MFLYSNYKPRIIPVFGDSDWEEIDRVQSIDKTGTINKTKVEEVGNGSIVGYIDQSPTISYRMTQYEYGALEFFNKICNKGSSNTSITHDDFKTPAFDICSYLTDDDDTFIGTLWLPKLRVSGFTLDISDPQALVERSFDCVGEDWIFWQGSNKYLVYKETTVESGDLDSGNECAISVSDPSAVQDPNDSVYILRVVRVRSSVATELTTSQYSYSAPTLTVNDCQSGDVIKYWYTAGSYIGGETPFTANTSDLAAIKASSATITLESSNTLYRLQSVSVSVTFDRQDLFEIGNNEVVQRGVKNKTVTITLGRLLEDLTLEEVLAGQTDDYGKLDIREFTDDLTLRIKFFATDAKSTFKIGYKFEGLAPTEIGGGVSVDAYTESKDTLAGEDLTISNVEATIDA